MPAAVALYPDWPQTVLQLNMQISANHSMRVLLNNGGRLVETESELVVYEPGSITFTVHHFVDGDTAFNVFADRHGWAFTEDAIVHMVQHGVLDSGCELS